MANDCMNFFEQNKSEHKEVLWIAGKHQNYIRWIYIFCQYMVIAHQFQETRSLWSAPEIEDGLLYDSFKVLVRRDGLCFNFALHAATLNALTKTKITLLTEADGRTRPSQFFKWIIDKVYVAC